MAFLLITSQIKRSSRAATRVGISGRRTMTTITPSFQELEEKYPRHRVALKNGETLSYVDVNCAQLYSPETYQAVVAPSHTLIVIPGYGCDSKYNAFTLARYAAFRDHRIVGVDPRGYGDSTQHTENWSHEENSQDIKLFMEELEIHKTMVLGYSTGGGPAAWLALNYPEHVTAVFMVSALPLNGMHTSLLSNTGKATGKLLITKTDAIDYVVQFMTPNIHTAKIEKFRFVVGAVCLDKANLPPNTDRGFQLYHEAAMKHQARAPALYANNAFNVTPIQTPISPPKPHVLSKLKCPMVIIHGANDALIKTRQVRAVTELAMVERWAPKGLLAYYEIPECGHMFMYDNPQGFQTVYRRALEMQVEKTVSKL